LPNFPVVPESFHLYVTTTSSFEEWTRVDSWYDLIILGGNTVAKKYFLDKDLGIVYFASGMENSLPSLGSSIVCSYSTTLRIEYEEEGSDMTLHAFNADVSPLTQYTNQGFVCLTHQDMSPANIVLSIDKPSIPYIANPKIYGPITVGSDYGLLKATVTTYEGIPVPGQEVSFTFSPSNVGYINGGSDTISVTDNKGNAYASYQPPVSAEHLGYYVTNTDKRTLISVGEGKTMEFIIPDMKADLLGQEENIYIYQILKDDLILGYDDVDTWITANMTAPPWTAGDPLLLAKWRNEVKEEYDLADWFEINTSEGIKIDGTIEGRKVVIYEYDASAINPTLGTIGAMVPMRPTTAYKITEEGPFKGYTRLSYDNSGSKFSLPDPKITANAIAGYWIVSTKNVSFQAFCWSPRYNRNIYSNNILARISLPQYLLGEYVNDLMEKIPYGWKLISDLDNFAAGLNGATFLTINPHSGPYKVLDLVGETSSSTWASAPFKSVAFQVYVPVP
jgi:hypothetical protein